MRRLVLPLAGVALAASLTGCSDPCKDLAPPTEAERQALAEAGDDLEIEREVGDTDCALTEDGRWEQDD